MEARYEIIDKAQAEALFIHFYKKTASIRMICPIPKFTIMKQDYWDVTDEQVIERTGKPISPWLEVLGTFHALEKKSNAVVAFLQNEHGVPRYWARTLTTHYLKKNGK